MEREMTIREEANALICCAVRNGYIEDLHSGDTSEVLKNPKLSRITNPEMKRLMVESTAKLAELLALKQENPNEYWRRMKHFNEKFCYKWDKGDSNPQHENVSFKVWAKRQNEAKKKPLPLPTVDVSGNYPDDLSKWTIPQQRAAVCNPLLAGVGPCRQLVSDEDWVRGAMKSTAGLLDRSTRRLDASLTTPSQRQLVGTSDDSSNIPSTNLVYVERLLKNGKHTITAQPIPLEEAEKMLTEFEFDLTLEENKGDRFTFQRGAERERMQIEVSSRLQCMLVLAMANIGKEIRHDAFDPIPSFANLKFERRAARIQQYRKQLNEILGATLTRRMFRGAVKWAYPIRDYGWSFCWVRYSKTPELAKFLI